MFNIHQKFLTLQNLFFRTKEKEICILPENFSIKCVHPLLYHFFIVKLNEVSSFNSGFMKFDFNLYPHGHFSLYVTLKINIFTKRKLMLLILKTFFCL